MKGIPEMLTQRRATGLKLDLSGLEQEKDAVAGICAGKIKRNWTDRELMNYLTSMAKLEEIYSSPRMFGAELSVSTYKTKQILKIPILTLKIKRTRKEVQS